MLPHASPNVARRGRAVPAGEARALEGLRLEVPGSIANLGPGFDALAVAVRACLTLTVRRVADGPRNGLAFDFGGLRLEGGNHIEQAFRTMAAREGVDFPSLELSVESEIPMRGGLGSSAAATVAGLRLFGHVAGAAGERDLLSEATALEGHPDNVAAALLGGLTASCVLDDGRAVAVSVPWPDAVKLVVATPEVQVQTSVSRQALPATLTRSDAVFNLQRATLLVQALATGRFDLVREALRDRWHQPARQPLVPGLAEALALEAPGLLGVCLSGSGPSVAALALEPIAPVERAVAAVYDRLGIPCRVRALDAHNGSR